MTPAVSDNYPLRAIVCGIQHSGTTLVGEILRRHPALDSGFEGGFLLNEDVADFLQPSKDLESMKTNWGVSSSDIEYICQAKSWPEAYRRLRERAEVIQNKDSFLYDKTPRYIEHLDEVLRKVPGVRCIVCIRDIRSFAASIFKRSGRSDFRPFFDEFYESWLLQQPLNYSEGLRRALRDGELRDRIQIVRYEHLCVFPQQEAERMFEFIGLEYSPDYLVLDKPKNFRVYGNAINAGYAADYDELIPIPLQDRILADTERISLFNTLRPVTPESDHAQLVKRDNFRLLKFTEDTSSELQRCQSSYGKLAERVERVVDKALKDLEKLEGSIEGIRGSTRWKLLNFLRSGRKEDARVARIARIARITERIQRNLKKLRPRV